MYDIEICITNTLANVPAIMPLYCAGGHCVADIGRKCIK